MSGPGSIVKDEEIGAALRQRRVDAGLSPSGLGRAISVTVQQIEGYERGSDQVSLRR